MRTAVEEDAGLAARETVGDVGLTEQYETLGCIG